MKIDTKGLSLLVQEASLLSNKQNWTKQDQRRNAFLLGAISAIKAGATLDEVNEQRANEDGARYGFAPVRIKRDKKEVRNKAQFLKDLYVQNGTKGAEFRGETEGAPMLAQLGTYSGLGSFVPTEFYHDVFGTMLETDPLIDENCVTLIKSTNGRVMVLPVYDDAANEAVLIGEAADTTGQQVNLGSPNNAKLAAYSFRTPIHKISEEAFQDISECATALDLFKRFASVRLARKIGQYLVSGSGVNQPTGLVTALAAVGAPQTVAAGSNANTGGAETGTTSVGSADLAKLYYSVNEAWRYSSKCAWLMNDTVLSQLMQMVTKQGLPIVDFRSGVPMILNKPVRVSPSMASNGSGNVPVIFGDLSQFVTRLVMDEKTGIRVSKEAPGLIEAGNFGMQMFMRADGCLAWKGDGGGTNSPIASIINHS
jgi:HK97 family phage major capsid protein